MTGNLSRAKAKKIRFFFIKFFFLQILAEDMK